MDVNSFETHFFVHSFAVARNLDSSFFNSFAEVPSDVYGMLDNKYPTHSGDLRLEGVVGTRVINLV